MPSHFMCNIKLKTQTPFYLADDAKYGLVH